jgi:hypothetical protein
MRSARTRCAWIEERTLRIGLRIKRATEGEVSVPELLGFAPASQRREPIPFSPFLAYEFLG